MFLFCVSFQMNSMSLTVLLLCLFAISIAAGWWVEGEVDLFIAKAKVGFLFKSRRKRHIAVSVDSWNNFCSRLILFLPLKYEQ